MAAESLSRNVSELGRWLGTYGTSGVELAPEATAHFARLMLIWADDIKIMEADLAVAYGPEYETASDAEAPDGRGADILLFPGGIRP